MKLLALIITILFSSLPVWSEVKVFATIDPKNGDLSTNFIYSVTITSDNRVNSSLPEFKSVGGFKLTYIGPRTSIQLINGIFSQQRTFQYQARPTVAGNISTPEGTINLEGKTFTIPQINVVVSKETNSQNNVVKDKNIILLQEANIKTVYLGQQLVNSIKLLSGTSLYEATIGDITTNGFWQLDMGNQTEKYVIFNNKRYRETTLKKALFPLNVGELTIPSRSIVATVNQVDQLDPFNDPFQSFFNLQSYRKITVKSNPIKIKVLPLPLSIPDEVVDPIVGLLNVKISTKKINLEANKSATFKVTVISDGNLSALDKLPIMEPATTSMFSEAPKTNYFENSGRLFTEKSFTYSIVPSNSGRFEITIPKIPHLNPELGKINYTNLQSIYLNVTGTTDLNNIDNDSLSLKIKPTVEAKSNKVSTKNSLPDDSPESTITWELILLIILILFVLFLILKILAKKGSIRREKNSLSKSVVGLTTIEQCRELFNSIIFKKYGITNPSRIEIKSNRLIEDKDIYLRILDYIEENLYSGQGIKKEDLELIKNEFKKLVS
jgi:hypothetical protein